LRLFRIIDSSDPERKLNGADPRKHLSEAMERYPDAANEIKAWVGIVEAARWHNFAEVRSMFKDADPVGGYVIFNIRQNRYRLITVVHYSKTTDEKQTEGHVYIRLS